MKKRIQLIIDITMTVLLPLLMAYSLIGEAFHPGNQPFGGCSPRPDPPPGSSGPSRSGAAPRPAPRPVPRTQPLTGLPPPGLCALSINHSNSYVAYPGSLTTGEIVLYDGHSLVSPRGRVVSSG